MADAKDLYKYSQNLNILYVEDDLELNEETVDIFKDLFNIVHTALDGEEGLEKYESFYRSSGKYYDIVITDIQMPKLNGIDLTAKIQKINPSQDIVVISAYSDSEKLMSLIDLGVNYFILKPLSHKKLVEVLYKACLFIENKKAQERLQFSQSKNSAMGAMIGNIIHQWNQPLNYISTVSSFLELQISMGKEVSNEKIINEMKVISNTVKRLSQTTDTFRNFLKEKKERADIVLQEKIEDALIISKIVLKDKGIKLIKDIEDQTPIIINTIGNELTEVIINIVNNAIDAIEEKEIKEGTVKIELIEENDYVLICIEDNAGGVPTEIMPYIFDEYFTTKGEDKGTGLGLHMSKRIVQESLKGELYVQNTQNGAKFFIKLPK